MKTKNMLQYSRVPAIIVAILCSSLLYAQQEKNELMLNLRYFNIDNRLPYLQVHTQMKVDNKLEVVPAAKVHVFMDGDTREALLADVVTNEKGDARIVIPAAMKAAWDSTFKHRFVAVAEDTKKYTGTQTEIEITKARIAIDTVNEDGARAVTANIEAFDGTAWTPVKDVEYKIGIRRLGGILPVGDEESYTTDSTGGVKAEFKRDSLPGDAKGNIVLVAKVDDNDQFGTLSLNKKVPWGRSFVAVSDFGHRTLYASRLKSPVWLMLLAYSIMAAVWGVLVYLLFQLLKIRKLGMQEKTTL